MRAQKERDGEDTEQKKLRPLIHRAFDILEALIHLLESLIELLEDEDIQRILLWAVVGFFGVSGILKGIGVEIRWTDPTNADPIERVDSSHGKPAPNSP